jgi:predicted nucleic acid-binding protein
LTEQWIVDASPLIILSKIDQQHLLTALAGELVVPRAVMEEIDAVPVLKALQSQGFHLDPRVIRAALVETTGETWG